MRYQSLLWLVVLLLSSALIACTTAAQADNLSEARILLSHGSFYARVRDWKRAESAFNKAIKLCPPCDTYIGRARFYAEHRELTKALSDHDKAIFLEPTNPIGYSSKASTEFTHGLYEPAVRDLTHKMNYGVADIWSLEERGVAYFHLGKYREAIADFDMVLETSPRDSSFYYRGLSNSALGRKADAVRDLKEARKACLTGIQKSGESPEVLAYLNNIDTEIKRQNSTREAFQMLISELCRKWRLGLAWWHQATSGFSPAGRS